MPYYKFKNTETNEEFEDFMSISSLDVYLKENPHLEQMYNGGPSIGDPMRLGRMKPSADFRERLREIKKTHKHSTINTQ